MEIISRLRKTLLKFYNQVDYPLRQFFRWQRSGYTPRAQPLNNYYGHLPQVEQAIAERRAIELITTYHLEEFQKSSSPQNFRENLYYLDLLITALERAGASLPDPIHVVDIGPAHWFYVQALYAGLKWWQAPQGRTTQITAYEADAYRVLRDFHSRYDHALRHIRNLPGVTYLPKAFTCQPGTCHLAVMFFPFVFDQDHLEWGLPARMFNPRQLLADAWNSLCPGGILLIVNQGEQEHLAEINNLNSLSIQPLAAFRQESLLYRYDLDRYVLVARHE